jgi:uncharacterized protein YjbJ (UPF0337 family)
MGLGDKIAGKVKEAAGKVMNDPDLRSEGDAQAKKGEADVQAAKDRAAAKAHEAEAEAKDAEMRAHQD